MKFKKRYIPYIITVFVVTIVILVFETAEGFVKGFIDGFIGK